MRMDAVREIDKRFRHVAKGQEKWKEKKQKKWNWRDRKG